MAHVVKDCTFSVITDLRRGFFIHKKKKKTLIKIYKDKKKKRNQIIRGYVAYNKGKQIYGFRCRRLPLAVTSC